MELTFSWDILCVAIFQTVTLLVINIKLSTLDPVALSFWVGLGSTIVSMILMFIFETIVFPGNLVCNVLLFGHSFLAGLASFCVFVSFSLLPPVKLALIHTLAVVFAFIGQHTAMKSIYPGIFNAFSVVGITTILIGNIIIPARMLWVAQNG